jgi:hypothetical protein
VVDVPSFDEEEFLSWLSRMSTTEQNTLAYGDDAVRLSDHIRGAIESGMGGRGWVAFRLDNGESNDRVYQDRSDAVTDAQRDLRLAGSACGFMKVPMDDCSPKAARSFIDFNRKLHAHGFRMTDPDQRQAPIMPRGRY